MILNEGQPLKAIHFVKRGKVVLLHNLGGEEKEEVQVRTVGQYENFGMHISHVGPNGRKATDTEVAAQLLVPQLAAESARAETYCDVVVLTLKDLSEIFTQEKLWSKLAAQRRRRPSKPGGAGRASGVAVRAACFASRIRCGSRFSRRKSSIGGGGENPPSAADTSGSGSAPPPGSGGHTRVLPSRQIRPEP